MIIPVDRKVWLPICVSIPAARARRLIIKNALIRSNGATSTASASFATIKTPRSGVFTAGGRFGVLHQAAEASARGSRYDKARTAVGDRHMRRIFGGANTPALLGF